MTLWTSDDMAKATGGSVSAPFTATGVSIDSRTLKKGEVYVALNGVSKDGHDFIAAAFAAGASGAIVREDFAGGGGPLLRVSDTLAALSALGTAARARAQGKIIGVTGSAGKTGTKDLLAAAFGALGKTHASAKSHNNHWGVPLTLANLPPDAAFGVFEMGMNHAGEMAALAKLVRPHIAVITTIEPAHAAHFRSMEEIADAKAEIFEGVGAEGTAILNRDNAHFQRLKAAALRRGVGAVIPFGEDEEAEARLVDCTLHSDGSRVEADILGTPLRYRLAVPGKHIVMNSLAVFAAVKAAGGDLERAAEAVRAAPPPAGRGNRFQVVLVEGAPPLTVIDESYNANPAAMEAALGVFGMVEPGDGGRRVAVLGDMLELGPEGPRLHAALANAVLKAQTDLFFCCGPQMDALYQMLPESWRGGHTKESKELAELVVAAVRPGDVVLVKGSFGSRMAYVVEALRTAGAGSREGRHAV